MGADLWVLEAWFGTFEVKFWALGAKLGAVRVRLKAKRAKLGVFEAKARDLGVKFEGPVV